MWSGEATCHQGKLVLAIFPSQDTYYSRVQLDLFDSNDLPQPIQLEYRLASKLCLTFGRDIPLKLPRMALHIALWSTGGHFHLKHKLFSSRRPS